jgi:hypothetical protein
MTEEACNGMCLAQAWCEGLMTIDDFDRRVDCLLAEGRAVIEESHRLVAEATAIRARCRDRNPEASSPAEREGD